jgi:exosortase K
MTNAATRFPYAKLAAVITAAAAIKQYYSTAGADDLRWILTPTTFLVELATGENFSFESGAGYINDTHSFLIAPVCAGVNFFITAFLMLTISRLLRYRAMGTGWLFVPLAAAASYLTTVIANAFRISIALLMRRSQQTEIWLTPDQLHRLEGIVVYFGFLVVLFIVSESLTPRSRIDSTPSRSFTRQYLPPLLAYYGTTIGVPLVNGAFHGTLRSAEFVEYATFVIVVPAVLLVPVLLVWMFTGLPAAFKPRVN